MESGIFCRVRVITGSLLPQENGVREPPLCIDLNGLEALSPVRAHGRARVACLNRKWPALAQASRNPFPCSR